MVQKVIFWTLSAAKVMTMLMMLETNIEKITPMRMIVLVESDRSSLYESPRMTSSEPNANKIAITIVPANGKPGSVTPKAMAQTAPSDAPDETPSVEPSASGFLSSPCIAAPARDRAAPVSATHSTRGQPDGHDGRDEPLGQRAARELRGKKRQRVAKRHADAADADAEAQHRQRHDRKQKILPESECFVIPGACCASCGYFIL